MWTAIPTGLAGINEDIRIQQHDLNRGMAEDDPAESLFATPPHRG